MRSPEALVYSRVSALALGGGIRHYSIWGGGFHTPGLLQEKVLQASRTSLRPCVGGWGRESPDLCVPFPTSQQETPDRSPPVRH